MLSIIFIMLPIFCILFLGAVSEKFQILPKETPYCINQFVYWFSLPLLRFNILAQMRVEQISGAITLGFIGGMLLTQCIVALCMYFAKYNGNDSVLGGMVAGLSNAAFMGIPTIILLYPNNEQALVIAAFISILPAVSLISTDTILSVRLSEKKASNMVGSCKNIAMALFGNPNLVAAILGACIGLGGFVLPQTLLITSKMVGQTAAPCALFCIGISLVRQLHTRQVQANPLSEKSSRTTILQSVIIITKLFICPAFMYGIGYLLGARGQELVIMSIIGAMPTAVVGSIISTKHNILVKECITCTLLSTCLSMVSIPLVVILLESITT